MAAKKKQVPKDGYVFQIHGETFIVSTIAAILPLIPDRKPSLYGKLSTAVTDNIINMSKSYEEAKKNIEEMA